MIASPEMFSSRESLVALVSARFLTCRPGAVVSSAAEHVEPPWLAWRALPPAKPVRDFLRFDSTNGMLIHSYFEHNPDRSDGVSEPSLLSHGREIAAPRENAARMYTFSRRLT